MVRPFAALRDATQRLFLSLVDIEAIERSVMSRQVTFAAPDFDPDTSLKAAKQGSPWVFACVTARSDDIAGLPLKVYEGDVELEEGNAAGLWMENPTLLRSVVAPGLLFRRQQEADLCLAGNWYGLKVRAFEGGPLLRVIRLHPGDVTINADVAGATSYVYTGNGVQEDLSPDEVFHVRRASFDNGAQEFFGASPIEVLRTDLDAAYNTTKQLAKSSRTGAPKFLLTPPKELGVLDAGVVTEMQKRFNARLRSSAPAIALGAGVVAKEVQWKPSDLDASGTRDNARTVVLAAMQVPPVRVGLETANYATAREQSATYWRGLERGDIPLLDAFWTQACREHTGSERLRVRSDLTGIGPLQPDRDAQFKRVQQILDWGLPLEDALKAEGVTGIDASKVQELEEEGEAMEEEGERELRAALELLEQGGDDPEAVAAAIWSLKAASGKLGGGEQKVVLLRDVLAANQ